MDRKPPNPLDLYEIEQIKVLKASGLSYYAVAKKVGRDHKTVKRCCIDPRNAEEIKAIQRQLASYFEDLSMRLITSISDEDIERLNAYQRIISAGISVDKLRLLRNESTQNVCIDTVNMNLKAVRERLAELRERQAKRIGEDYETLHEPKSELLENPENLEKKLALENKTHTPK